MFKIKIKNDELVKEIIEDKFIFPKYTTQLINLANQNAQGNLIGRQFLPRNRRE